MRNLDNPMRTRKSSPINIAIVGIALLFTAMVSEAAINLDRTRIIFNDSDKSASVILLNQSKSSPYLAQSWLENAAGQKVDSPLVALPPMQRIDAGQKSQVRIMKLPDADKLPTDRETLFYFNIREVPPKSEMTNVVQIAIQNRVKLFYRPVAIKADYRNIWQEKLQLSKQGESLKIHNPTPYYITLGYLSQDNRGNFPGFDSVMIAPFGTETVKTPGYSGSHYTLGYMDDFGGMKMRIVNCSAVDCQIQPVEKNK
ncbi:fimbrial biogenesis chaperone [Yersinia aleksiciae]|uniref:Fimbrial assembly protein n=1 Tax=Yersinia aleksiciae TaxID=263819 RepID=A0A0T9UUZ8_YERAE|nr:molecular chaperone [Yersinia aleksiciae]AKP33629.1 fimbrial assembly protein [Yersinia aleksiciae]MDA5496356.1 molecular chaperone [Yersinia aleksiciae]NIK99766.1 molecular chaperone [Yersinia aleksiciae]WQC70750.1 molecular chaperone [Yersinia aleksiciae]CFQ53560.1 fimbrial chaperone [Yersinia aleksiciae]